MLNILIISGFKGLLLILSFGPQIWYRQRILQQSIVFLRQNPGESHLTPDELSDMVDIHCFYIFMSKLWRYLGNITGSSAYWHKVREDLKAIIAYKEAPTSFFLHFPQLICIGQICTPFLVSNQTLLTLKKEGWIQGQKKHLGTSLNSTKLHSRKT